MKQYAIVDDGNFVEFRDFDVVPVLPGKPYRKFYEVVRETGTPPFEGVENGKWMIRTAPVEPSVPQYVTARQARLALLQVGLLSNVASVIANSSTEVQITWEYATEWDRKDPYIISIGTNLGLSNTEIDQLFIVASNL